MVENVQNLTLTGDDRFGTGLLGLPAPSSQIHCNRINGTGFDFENLFNVIIEKILFMECVHETKRSVVCPAFGALTLHQIFNTTISMVTIQQSPGCGIVAVKMFGSITDSIFLVSNNTLACVEYYDDYNCTHRFNNYSTTFTIKSTHFHYGYGSGDGGGDAISAGGLTFQIENTCPGITIMIDNITAYGNVGTYCGQMYLHLRYMSNWNTQIPSITVTNSQFVDGHADILVGVGGGGVFALFVFTFPHPMLTYIPLTFANCTFQGNHAIYGGAVFIHVYKIMVLDVVMADSNIVLFQSCVFQNNTSLFQEGEALFAATINFILENCTFSKSSPVVHTANSYSVIYLVHSNVTISNCRFEDNIGTAITVADSIITFEGTNTFRNNSATDGGALLFSTNSYMFLQNNTHIYFINNHAEYSGGAIYVRDGDCVTDSPCFFQIPSVYVNITLNFENNTATFGGTALYGGLLNDCGMLDYDSYTPNSTWHLFEEISGLHNTVSEPSTISSDPIGVCFCTNNITDCDKKWNNITVYPGQSFNISAITVGQRNGTVRGVIHADIDHGTIGLLQGSQSIQSCENCTKLTYRVFTLEKYATLTLTISDIGSGRVCFLPGLFFQAVFPNTIPNTRYSPERVPSRVHTRKIHYTTKV